jgi:hypothetical protein
MPLGSFEGLTIRVAFTATSGTTTSATGVLQATSDNEKYRGSLEVGTKGLPAGIYQVSAITDSGSASVTLGTFDVRDPQVAGPAAEALAARKVKTRTDFGGPGGIAFPKGFDPFDIASLAISGSNTGVLFTADLTTIANGTFYARTPMVSGTGVTAKGMAQIQALAKAGVVTGALTLKATGLPHSTTYTYAIDGKDIGNVTTGSAGSLKLIATEKPAGGTLPAKVDLFAITGVTIHDDTGKVILSASF